ncbi:MAG: hypothetical protein M3N33_12380 [Actinomycetota bacterium]|nr:hypothetical protein [Actinomycetota bacterium]
MDLERLYGGSFIDWGAVSASWNKRTVPSRLLLFAARRYAEAGLATDEERAETLALVSLPEDIKRAYAAPPPAEGERARLWGAFVDAAFAAELEMVSYGERPPLLHEIRAGLSQAAEEAGPRTERGRWFMARHDALPGTDLPDSPDYLPI